MRNPPTKTMSVPMVTSLILIIASGQSYKLTDIIDKSVQAYNPANLVIVIDSQSEEDAISDFEMSGIKEALSKPRLNGTLTTSLFVYDRQVPESYAILDGIISSSEPCSLVILASDGLLDTLESISKQKCRGHLQVILAYDDKTPPKQSNLEVVTYDELKEDKDPRLKLSGRVVKAVQDEYFPYFFTTANGSFDGYFYQVSQVIAERLNITIEYVPNTRDPGTWGYIQPDGTWNGMMAMVMDGEADMAAPGFFRHPDRDRAVDFSVNVIDATFVLFTQRNSRNRISVKNYLGEFTIDVWILIGMTSFLLISAFICFLKVWNGYYQNTQSLSIVLRGLVYRGSKEPSKRYSVKSLMVVNLLFASVIVISYRSCLNAFLTIQVPVLDVKSFEDIESSGKALTFWKGGLMEGVLSSSSEGTIERKMYEKYLRDEKAQVESYEEGMQNAIEDENYVFVGPSMLAGMAPCNVTQVKAPLDNGCLG